MTQGENSIAVVMLTKFHRSPRVIGHSKCGVNNLTTSVMKISKGRRLASLVFLRQRFHSGVPLPSKSLSYRFAN